MTVADVLEQAKSLSVNERWELIRKLRESLDLEMQASTPKHSIMELAGLGKQVWEGIDAQEYINQLRSEWDARSR
jgi:hypothetical protein